MSTTGNRGMLALITTEQIGIETTYQANRDKKHHKCSTKICYSRYITKTNCGHGNLVIKLHKEVMKRIKNYTSF